MVWQITPYVAVSIAAVILLTTTAVSTYRRETIPGTNKTSAVLLMATAVWVLGAALEVGCFSLKAKVFWDRVQLLGILTVPTGWLIYMLQCSGRDAWLTRWRLLMLSALPAIFMLLVLTNEGHRLVWSSISLDRSLPASELEKARAPAFWIIVIHSYLMLGAGTFFLIRMVKGSRRSGLWQVAVLLTAITIPWVINLLELLGFKLIDQVDATALAMAVASPAIAWGMWRIRVGDLVPVARNMVIDSMSDAVIVMDTQQRVLDMNPSAKDLIGRSTAELIGRSIGEAWAEWRNLTAPFAGDLPTGQELPLRVDGILRTYDVQISPVTDGLGRLVSRVVVLRDISERRRAEETVRESALRYRLLAENSTDMIAQYTPEGECLYISPTCQSVVGFEPQEMIGNKIYRLIHSDDMDKVLRGMARMVRAPEVQTLRFRLRRKDDMFIWVEMIGRGIFTEEGGYSRPKEIITVTRDITERKDAEDQLAAERERLAVTLRSIGDGVVALDASRRVVFANPVAEEHLNALAGVSVGASLTHLADHPLEALLDSSHPGKNIHEIVLEGSPNRYFEVVVQPMETGTKAGGWVLVMRDITEERDTQRRIQLQERLAAVGQLAAGIAHDFNNILGAIILYSEMLLQAENLAQKDHERLLTIYQQAERAATLTRQILDYSRRTVMDQAPMDLAPFLSDMQKLLSRTLPEGIRVSFTQDNDNYVVNADPARIQQILMNLSFNARDAMPEGGELRFELSRLRVESSEPPPFRDMAPGAWIRLRVSDTGVGIEPDVLPHIFEPFYTTKGPGEGSGLGLAQVYGIVKQHDGYIDVKSQVEIGTTFIIYLPAIEVPEWSSVRARADALIEGQGETILVVEDDLATQMAVREILETLNYQVLTASNGQEALIIIEQRDGAIDLVLSDMVMPEMGGVELYQELVKRGFGSKVVLMSGYPLGSGTRELLDQKGVTWLQKPLRSDSLARLIRDVIENQKS
jgi:PAS domain S-box-containing protein